MVYQYPGHSVVTAQIGRQAHPDVLANIIAQDIVAHHIEIKPDSSNDVNVTLGGRVILLTGQIRPEWLINYEQLRSIVNKAMGEVRYPNEGIYNPLDKTIIFDFDGQSQDIAGSVYHGKGGDTIVKHGLAVKETDELLPLAHVLATRIAKRLDALYLNPDLIGLSKLRGLGPDGKVNLGIAYENGRPKYAKYVIIAAQQRGGNPTRFWNYIKNKIILPVLDGWYNPCKTEITINGSNGVFYHGGPVVDRGVKGKKDADSTYGDSARQTGGSSYGKDPTKVDFHALVSARHIAKNIVANGLAGVVEVRLGYKIGGDVPLVLSFDTFGTSEVSSVKLEELVRRNFPLAPREVIEELNLRQPWILQTTAREHFFGNPNFPWERVKKLQ
ncbi:MAG: methionine adenosyltransferase domain-containing protein [Nanoarchaeota archaeon]